MSGRRGVSRDNLLTAAIEFIVENGTGDWSLRQLATAAGTSHRMLIYHFGSKDELVAQVIAELEKHYQDMVTEWLTSGGPSSTMADELRRIWKFVTDQAQEPYQRLFFEFHGRALLGHPPSAAWLDRNVDTWMVPLTQGFKRAGMSLKIAHEEARLTIAVFRGLQLDFLATGNRSAANRAMERFLARYESATAAPTPPQRNATSQTRTTQHASKLTPTQPQ